jgi:hypothetical protein
MQVLAMRSFVQVRPTAPSKNCGVHVSKPGQTIHLHLLRPPHPFLLHRDTYHQIMLDLLLTAESAPGYVIGAVTRPSTPPKDAP